MKRIIVLLLALSMLLALCACGKKQETPKIIIGGIDELNDREDIDQHVAKEHANAPLTNMEKKIYTNLSTALLALEKGEITWLATGQKTAEYVLARNEKLTTVQFPGEMTYKTDFFSMMTTAANTELYGILDSAIKELKASGKLEQLITENLDAYINGDPTPAALPTFEGAKTYKIAVTGDLPPMDFVTADGHAAGFNVALLSAIANIAQVNFELVPVDTGARVTALTTNKVDAVFWTVSYGCQFCGERFENVPAGTLITEDYFCDQFATLALKPAA